jgi:flagellar hook protein FlgE
MAFQQGLSGLNIASKALDAISNNVANSTTVGFKQSMAQFADIYASTLGGGGSSQIGIGAMVNGVAQQFSQGNITVTSNPLDLAINGEGFFRMNDSGTTLYTRNGQFSVDKSGYIVNGSGYRLTGYGVDADDNIVVTAPIDLQIDTALSGGEPNATTTADLAVNLDSRRRSTDQRNLCDHRYQQLFVFDFADRLRLARQSARDVALLHQVGDAERVGCSFAAGRWGRLGCDHGQFNSNGNLVSPTTIAQSFPVTTGAVTTLDYDLNLTNSTQFGTNFSVNAVSQDGFRIRATVRHQRVAGRRSAGPLHEWPVAQPRSGGARHLPEPDGMTQLGSNAWAETSFSGPPAVGEPGTGNRGGLQPGAVEDSNVDLTAELVNMITQQRAYQANAQSIKTQDQIMQTLVNLR